MVAPKTSYQRDEVYERCEVCEDYTIAPLGGVFCKCHRGDGHRVVAVRDDVREVTILMIRVGRRSP
jgi:hypothetical protein